MNIDNFYRIKKIQQYYSTAGHILINNVFYEEGCTEIIFNKSLSLIKPLLYYTVITKYSKFADYYWKFTSNSYMFSGDAIGGFMNIPIINNKSLKEGDYVYIDTGTSFNKISKEDWWKFLGNLKNPDLELIDLCTTIINND